MASEFGQLCELSEVGTRDAGHVAFVVITATESMYPGQRVRFNSFMLNVVSTCYFNDYHGLVDPFLATYVKPGQSCRILLAPGMTRNLRHSFDVVLYDDTVVSSQETKYEEVDNSHYDDYDDGCKGCV
jgi:hypothetical protein